MATPEENTEVVRMLRDFRNAVSGTPYKFNKPLFFAGRKIPDTDNITTKLNFSDCFNSTIRDKSSSSIVTDPAESPEMLKRKLMSQELELHASRAALKEKEAAITLMEPANKRICLSLEQKMEDLNRKHQADVNKIVQLSSRLKYIQNDASMAKSRVLECETEKKLECDKLQMEVLATQRECSNLKFEIAEVKSEKAETVRKLNSEISRLELKVSALTEESQSSKEFIQSLKKQVYELTDKVSKSIGLQEELCEAQKKVKLMEDEIARNEDSSLIVKSMQSELHSVPTLQKENQILKEELNKYKENNVSLFQEKMWAFQEKLAQAEKKNIEFVKLQIENESLKSKLSQWNSLYDDLNLGTKSPAELSKRLSNYQKNELLMMNKFTKISARCKTLEKQNAMLETNMKSLKKATELGKQNMNNDDHLLKRLKSRISLLTRERDGCRQLIDSYISDCTLSGTLLSSAHMKNLEDTIEEYRKSLEKTDEEITSLKSEVKTFSKSVEDSANLVKHLQEEKSKLLLQIKDLELKPSSSAEANAAERIVHFQFNPLDVANKNHIEDVKNLREENDRLKKRIKVLEEEGACAADVTAKVVQKLEKEGSETTLQELQDKVVSFERKNKLILEVARSQSKEFREAVYHLTGYNVDRQSAGKYKLAHVYAESPDDFLLFEVNARGVQLLETRYSSSLVDLMETYLHNCDSFPAFLASLTLDLFKQQTFMLSQQTITIT